MPLKFKRSYRLLVDTVDTSLKDAVKPILTGGFSRGFQAASFLSNPKAIQINPPITIDFVVKRHNIISTNTADITIYNLNLNTRSLIRKDQWETDVYRPVELWAGYADPLGDLLQQIDSPNKNLADRQDYPTIFRGNVTRAYSYRQGVNFLTKLECQDAGFAFVNSDVNLSYGVGVPYRQIILDLIAAMGPLPDGTPTITVGAVGDFPGETKRAFSIVGDPKAELAYLTGGHFYIDSEKAYCLQENEYNGHRTVPKISDANGLLGVPVKADGYVSLDMLFEPGLVIGQLVELETTTVPYYNSNYIVQSITHKGMISETTCGSVITSVVLGEAKDTDIPIFTQ